MKSHGPRRNLGGATSDAIRKRYADAIALALPRWAVTQREWGRSDCALELANIDVAVQGIDPAAPYRGRYRTERGARRVLGKGGLTAAWGRAARRLGWRRIDPRAAKDGDRGIARTTIGPTSAIRYRGRWFIPADMGNIMTSDEKIMRAWAVA